MSPRGRAALVALALALGLVAGLPLPPPAQVATLSPPLQRVLAGIGAAQSVILAPFQPLMAGLLVGERWSLFAGASQERFRFELSARPSAREPFKILYRADDDRHRFLSDLIEYRRVRGAWNPRTAEPAPGYDAFASFIAERVFRERPELREVRLRMERIHILDRGGYVPSGEFVHERLRVRSPRHGRRGGGAP